MCKRFSLPLLGLVATLATLALPAYGSPVGYSPLRNHPIASEPAAPVMRQDMEKTGGFTRAFIDQPPLIPHGIRGYQQTHEVNMCLMCHKEVSNTSDKIPAIGASHYTVINGQPRLAANRYFCVQCHIPQADVKALVKNDYQPAETQER